LKTDADVITKHLEKLRNTTNILNEKEHKRVQELKLQQKVPNKKIPEEMRRKRKEELSNTLLCNHHDLVFNWFGSNKQLHLLYKATRDGFKAQDFHSKCDNKGETITVIKSTKGFTFGGYTPISWSSHGDYAWENQTFIFTLSNPHQFPPTKYITPGQYQNNRYSIHNDASFGPSFGVNDISVFTQSNQSTNSYFNFPCQFSDTTGKGNTTFTGESNFQVADIEVFAVSQT